MAETKKYVLTAETVDQIGEDLRNFFASEGIDRKMSLRICLVAEEALLKYRDAYGDGLDVELKMVSRTSVAKVQMTVFCAKMDPFRSNDNGGIMSSLLTASEGNSHIWKFNESNHLWNFEGKPSEGRNDIIFQAPKDTRISAMAKLGAFLGGGIILAFLTRLFFSPEVCQVISEQFVLPIANIYTGLLSVMAIVMIFCALPLCIVQYGNGASFQDSTRHLIGKYMKSTILWVVLLCIIGTVRSGITASSIDGTAVAESVLAIFIDFFPSNIVAPFLNFNCMQVIIIGIMFGFAFLKMGEGSRLLVDVFDKVNYVAVLVNHWFNDFIHVYVGLMAYYLVMMKRTESMTNLLSFILLIIAMALGMALVTAVVTAKRMNIRLTTLIKKFAPSFLVNFTSASVGASFVNLFDELTVGCGVNIGYSGMACNLGTVLYKPAYAAFLVVSGFFACALNGGLTVALLIQIFIYGILLPASIPNIQGGAAAAIILMISQLGFSSEVAELLVAMNVLLQFIIVPVDIFMMQCMILQQSKKEGMMEEGKLKD